MTIYIIQIPSGFQSNPQFKPLIDVATSKNGMMIGVLITVMILVQVFSGGDKKGKIARGYLGGLKEKRQAALKAKKQMKAITRNEVSLYVGCPQQVKEKLHSQWQAQGLIDAKAKPPKAKTSTLFVPDAQRGTSVLGAAGSGKTFSVIDPLVRFCFRSGLPDYIVRFQIPGPDPTGGGLWDKARLYCAGFRTGI
jgi:hypothetical protein